MTGSKAKTQSEDQTESDSEDEESNSAARSRSARKVQIKTSIKPDEVTKLFDDILQTSVVSEVDEEHTEQQFTKLMDFLHKFYKGHMIALCKYHTMPEACIDDQGRAAHNIIKGLDSNMKSCIVHPHSYSLNSQIQFHKIQGSFMLLCLIKNIFGKDHTAIDKQAKELKNCIAEYTTAQDLAKYWRDVLSNRAIYTKLFQYFAQPGNDRRMTKIELCETVLSEVYKQNRQLAKTLRVSLDRKPFPITLDELLAKLEEDHRIEQRLCE